MSKILVIDDDTVIRANLADMLEAEGFEVVSADDGRRQHLPDLIICDIMLPDLDGYGVLDELRRDEATATVPFIFLSARADKADVRQAMTLGADDYLTKPFKRPELLHAIAVRLAKQSSVSIKYQRKLDDLRDSITLALPHELRTPLTGILGLSAILVED